MHKALGTLLAILLLGGVAVAQQEGVLQYMDFEKDAGGFATMDREAKLTVTHEAALVYKGTGSLQLAFPQRAIKQGPEGMVMPGSLVLPVPAPLKDLKSLSFAAAAFHSTALAVMLSEGDNAPRYMLPVWCEAGDWHVCKLSLDQFHLDGDSPPDPDGHLVAEKIKAVVILDLGGMLRAMTDQQPMIYSAPPVDQTLWLDEFKLLSTAPEALPQPPDGVRVTDYKAPAAGLVLVGGKDVSLTDEDDDQGQKALKLEYTLPPQTIMGLVHLFKPDMPTSFTAFRFRAKSTGNVTLVVRVEEKRGKGMGNIGYQTMVSVKGMKPWQTITVPISSLKPEGDQTAARPPDLSKVDALMIMDMSAMGGAGGPTSAVKNTLWLDDMVVVK